MIYQHLNMIVSFVLTCLLFVPVYCHLIVSDLKELFESSDQVCKNDNYSKDNFIKKIGMNKFTGVRVFKVYKMTFYPMAFEESIRFIYCDGGKNLQEKIIIQEDQTSDAYWNETFELTFVDPSTKLKFSRRQGFVNHDKSYVVPGSIIGGLFHCFDDSCNSENSEPMLPVYSYMHESMWTQTTRGNSLYNWTLEKYIPLMSTTNDYFRSNKLKQLVAGHNRHRIADIYEKIAKARTQNITRTCTENWCVMI